MKPCIRIAMCILLFCCLGCGQRPKLFVTAMRNGDNVDFLVQHTGTNGLLGLRVKDNNGNLLWSILLNYDNGCKITYGHLPQHFSSQLFPADGTKPQTIAGSIISLEIDYQYDDPAPSAGTFIQQISIPGQ